MQVRSNLTGQLPDLREKILVLGHDCFVIRSGFHVHESVEANLVVDGKRRGEAVDLTDGRFGSEANVFRLRKHVTVASPKTPVTTSI